MKKLLAMALSLVMACSIFTACGEKDDSDKKEKDNSSVSDSSDKDNSKEDDKGDSKDDSKDDSSKEDEKPGENNKPTDKMPEITIKLSGDNATPLGETVGDEFTANEDTIKGFKEIEGSTEMTMDITITSVAGGMTIDSPMVVSTNGKDTYLSMNMMGMSINTLTTGGKSYILDDKNKVYCFTEDTVEENPFDEIETELDSVKSANKVTIDGVELDRLYESDDEGEGYVYLYNGNIVCMVMLADEATTLMKFNRLEAKADADLLKLPADYKEVSEDEYAQLVYGDIFGDIDFDDDDLDFDDDDFDFDFDFE